MNLQPKHIALSILLILYILLSVATLSYAYFTNEGFGFPLDDPWIHLQFAKNLHQYGSFSYYQDEMVTSGSTAPLYTLLLAAGFFFTNNELILSYVLGILFSLLAVVYFYRLLEILFPTKTLYAFAGTLLLVLEPRLQWAGLSGMETSLFIFLILATSYYWMKRAPVATGLFGGMLLWTRPEAIILFVALGADLVLARIAVSREGKKTESSRAGTLQWLFPTLAVLGALGAGYVLFNYLLSGSLLPNTYAAKVKYYAHGGGMYPSRVLQFLSDGHLIVFSVLAAAGIAQTVTSVIRRRPAIILVPLLFSVGMFLAYWIKLPYLYQNGRYLIPILPFILLLGLVGMDWLLTVAGRTIRLGEQQRKALTVVLFLYLGIHFLVGSWESRALYQDFCKYISDRQVRTALWIRDHLPGNAVVATHDVGAVAYYSERRIVDMVGLISPEMIENIGHLDRLKAFLIRGGVTHLALLRNWFEVVNVNPVFQTNEQTPEIMEVFEFDPDKAHFTSSQVGKLTDVGWQFLVRGNVVQGVTLVERAVQLDPNSSRARHRFGWGLMMIGRLDQAEEELNKALELHPTNWEARFALAQVSLRRNRPREAIGRLEQLTKDKPDMVPAYQALAQIYAQTGDTARARLLVDEFHKRNKQATD
ncbi:MAG: tetratricopeptide repeat protein [Ignavibacteriales bacterium]|nr:tetratricopeptide repeat protein [Ignavibacteriales bacterium]